MDWEALIVIGLFTLILGVLLFVPTWLWARRKFRIESEDKAKLRLTKVGWVLICITILALIGGFSLQYVAPESELGQLVRTPLGRFLYLAIVIFVFWLVEAVLKARNIRLIERDSSSLQSNMDQ